MIKLKLLLLVSLTAVCNTEANFIFPNEEEQTINAQQPVRPQQPVHPQQPLQPQKPLQPQQPSHSQQPLQPQQPSHSQQPLYPQQPPHSQQPLYPQQPPHSQQPLQPQKPPHSQQPLYPQQPLHPQQPQQPLHPQQPQQPSYPQQPLHPQQPQQPSYPQQPLQPQQPLRPQESLQAQQQEALYRKQLTSDGITKFAINLEKMISANDPTKNTLFSPLSIASALALLLLGAQGKTEMEIANLMGLKLAGVNLTRRSDLVHEQLGELVTFITNSVNSNKEKELTAVTALFPQINYPIKKKYVQQAKTIYRSEVHQMDYYNYPMESMEEINKWVKDKTRGRITEILDEIPSANAALILASALYFTSPWEFPFLPQFTKLRPFYLESHRNKKEEVIQIPMMANVAEVLYLNDKVRKFELLGLPYEGSDVYMYILLPDRDLKGFLRGLKAEDLQLMIASTKKQQVIYVIPRMKLEESLNLRPYFENLGLKGLFDPVNSNLSNIADGIYLSKILHKVEVEVNENGTTASAATSTTLKRDGSTPVIRVEKPFLFFIYHQSRNIILFWGTIMQPPPFTPEVLPQYGTVPDGDLRH